MKLKRILLAILLLVICFSGAQAKKHPKVLTTVEIEARNEALAPSFAGQIREAHRIAEFLVDALVLNNAQKHAVEAYTITHREALVLAVTVTDIEKAQQEYLLAVRRGLATSQQTSYAVLRLQLNGTMLALDGVEFAQR